MAAAAETCRIYSGALPHPIFTNAALYERFLQGYMQVGFDKDVMLGRDLG
jgi:hypothetical protein